MSDSITRRHAEASLRLLAQKRRNNAARTIQARARGVLARKRFANPNKGKPSYSNIVSLGSKARPIGYRALKAMFESSPNRKAKGARIRAGIRYGPEHYVSTREQRHWRMNLPTMNERRKRMAGGVKIPRGFPLSWFPPRQRSSPRRRSNNNNLYA